MTGPIALAPKPTVAEAIKTDCVRLLRDALARAEAGEIEAVAVILKLTNGRWYDERSGVMDFPEAVGRLEIVKQSWISHYLKGD